MAAATSSSEGGGSEEEAIEGEDGDDSDDGATGKRKDLGSYNFRAEDERVLVDFFREHPCFYDKTDKYFANAQYRARVLGDMARELECSGKHTLLHTIIMTQTECARIYICV